MKTSLILLFICFALISTTCISQVKVKSETAVLGIDTKGRLIKSPGLKISVGKIFKSETFNVPVNAYVCQHRGATYVGASMGINFKKKKIVHYKSNP